MQIIQSLQPNPIDILRRMDAIAHQLLRNLPADKAPGMDQGHFGLQGIRERVHRLKGSVSIASAAGRGTTVELKGLSTDI